MKKSQNIGTKSAFTPKKKKEFSNWKSETHGWQIESSFLGVKHGK